MDSPYGPSLVWVCLACGQIAPYHASPSDLVDSASAMDLSLAAPPSAASSVSPPHLPSLAKTSVGLFCSSEERHRRAFLADTKDTRACVGDRDSLSKGSSCSRQGSGVNSYAPPRDSYAASHRCHADDNDDLARVHRGRFHDCGDACLSSELDSYLSMAAASRLQRRHENPSQPQRSVGDDEVDTVMESAAEKAGASPRHGISLSSSTVGRECHCRTVTHRCLSLHEQGASHHTASASRGHVPGPMQSLAALLMEEHPVGSREMRFCENCREVRCSEIRNASEVMQRFSSGDDDIVGLVYSTMIERPGSEQLVDGSPHVFTGPPHPLRPSTDYPETLSYHSISSGNSNSSNSRSGSLHRHSNLPSLPSLSCAPHTDHAANSGPADSSFLCTCCDASNTSGVVSNTVNKTRSERRSSSLHSRHSSSRFSAPPASFEHSYTSPISYASAARDGRRGKREIPSVHLTVALSLARMLLKLKSAAVTIIHNFHPLSPSLPPPRPSCRTTESDTDNSSTDSNNKRDDLGNSLLHKRTEGLSYHYRSAVVPPPLSSPTAAGTTPSSHDLATKPYPRQLLSSLNSSLDETAVTGGAESNGISYNSFTTTASQQHQQRQYPQQQQFEGWDGRVQRQQSASSHGTSVRSGDEELKVHSFPVGEAARAPLLSPKNTVGRQAAKALSGSPSTPTANDTAVVANAALLRACKDRWNSMSVPEALWRVVLPSFSPPFLGSTHSTVATSPSVRSRGGSCQSTPHRGSSGSTDMQAKPYRSFRGEVQEAISRLDSMQLEVAKLRLEQALAEVAAEQARRETADSV
jgi:hypothetical protein